MMFPHRELGHEAGLDRLHRGYSPHSAGNNLPFPAVASAASAGRSFVGVGFSGCCAGTSACAGSGSRASSLTGTVSGKEFSGGIGEGSWLPATGGVGVKEK